MPKPKSEGLNPYTSKLLFGAMPYNYNEYGFHISNQSFQSEFSLLSLNDDTVTPFLWKLFFCLFCLGLNQCEGERQWDAVRRWCLSAHSCSLCGVLITSTGLIEFRGSDPAMCASDRFPGSGYIIAEPGCSAWKKLPAAEWFQTNAITTCWLYSYSQLCTVYDPGQYNSK